MARTLTVNRFVVPLPDRDRYLERLRRRQNHFRGANCRFWIFEEMDLSGAFIEFIEAADAETLEAALEGAPDKTIEAMRIYQEVEL
jgi:hypothetical protein